MLLRSLKLARERLIADRLEFRACRDALNAQIAAGDIDAREAAALRHELAAIARGIQLDGRVLRRRQAIHLVA